MRYNCSPRADTDRTPPHHRIRTGTHTPVGSALPLESKADMVVITSLHRVRLELDKRALRRVGDRKPHPLVHHSTRVWKSNGFIVALVRR